MLEAGDYNDEPKNSAALRGSTLDKFEDWREGLKCLEDSNGSSRPVVLMRAIQYGQLVTRK